MKPAFHPAVIQQLRQEMGAGRRHGTLSLAPAVDACLGGGGLALGALHEMEPGEGTEAQMAAGSTWLAARLVARMGGGRPALWVARECDLYAPGLLGCGLDPARLVLARARDDTAVLAAMEAALRSGAFAAVVGEAGRLPRLAGQRLQLACLRHGTTGLLLRRWPQGRPVPRPGWAPEEAPAAMTRWRIGPAPSDTSSAGPFAPPRWRLELRHARGGLPGEWVVEAGDGDAADPVRVVAELADPAAAAQRRRHG
jgi:protein ImuA